jgi:hypothetical protein
MDLITTKQNKTKPTTFLHRYRLVWPVLLAQVWTHSQLIFPSKTWFFGNYFGFSAAEMCSQAWGMWHSNNVRTKCAQMGHAILNMGSLMTWKCMFPCGNIMFPNMGLCYHQVEHVSKVHWNTLYMCASTCEEHMFPNATWVSNMWHVITMSTRCKETMVHVRCPKFVHLNLSTRTLKSHIHTLKPTHAPLHPIFPTFWIQILPNKLH